MLATGLILIGICSRLLSHGLNFTPVIAIALFAGYYLPRRQAIIVPLVLFIICDALIGFHAMILFTWGSMALIALVGIYFKNKKSWKNIALSGLLSAVLFYLITNFGVWLYFNTYPKTIEGLLQCYIAAIPYFRNSLLSTALYGAALFGSYEFFAARLKNSRYASVL